MLGRACKVRWNDSVRYLPAFALCTLLLAGVACGSAPAPIADPAAPPAVTDRPAPPAHTAAALDPPQPALRLPRNFLPTSYRARLALDPTKNGFRGSIEIDGEVHQRSQRIWLHGRELIIASAVATQNGRTIPLEATPVGDQLLSLRPAVPLEIGTITLALEYTGVFDLSSVDGAYKGTVDGETYMASELEPFGARRVYPCFDEPDNKVPWQLTLDVPAALVALSNTDPTTETALDATTKRVAFAKTSALPSYLVAFAVGPYDLVDAGTMRNGVRTRIAALRGYAHQAKYAAETSNKIVALLEDYFGIPYPYDKLDQISRPHAFGGAIENPGLITYAKPLLLIDPAKLGHTERIDWVDIAAHELAHQWFGNMVTMAWWDDLWLNEAFATWIGEKTLAAFEPSWRGDLRASRAREWALSADSLVTARSVRQPITSDGDVLQAFDTITYTKGAQVLAMFEHMIGPDKFRDGVRAYLAKHRGGNATAADFFAALSQAAGRDIAPAFRTFLDQPGAPMVRAELRCEAGAAPSIALHQSRFIPPGAAVPDQSVPWHLPVCVAYEREGRRAEACTELTTPTGELALDGKACPAWWFGNAGAHGYYRVLSPEADVIALRDRGWKQLTQPERIAAFGDLTAFMRAGKHSVALQMSFVPKMLAERHRDGVAVAVNATYWMRARLTADQRPRFARWIRATFGPAARALSWLPRKPESVDTEYARRGQVPLVAAADDPKLRAEAVALARRWRTLPPSIRRAVLEAAADTDAATFERLLAAAPAERDHELRQDLLSALGYVRDEARLRRALALALDPRILPVEAPYLMFNSWAETSGVVAAYFREHIDELLARYPEGGSIYARPASLATVFTRSCEPAEREATVAFISERFAKISGGPRAIAQATERLDQCIAARATIAASADAWLKTLR